MDSIQWWCAAQNLPWTWSWRPYPGVWLFVAALAVGYWRLTRIAPPSDDVRRRVARIGGLVTLWLALDWPVGALGGGYLASVHTLQYLMIAMLAPTLLLVGLPPGTSEALAASPAGGVLRRLTHPIVAAALYSGVLVTTHLPAVTDGLMATQAGSFVIDVLWLVSGLLFWWPIVGVPPGRTPLSAPLKIGTIVLGSLLHTPLAMWLMMAELPVYATYELAPPIAGLDPRSDQQLASAVMLVLGWLYILGAISLTFFRWQGLGEERR